MAADEAQSAVDSGRHDAGLGSVVAAGPAAAVRPFSFPPARVWSPDSREAQGESLQAPRAL